MPLETAINARIHHQIIRANQPSVHPHCKSGICFTVAFHLFAHQIRAQQQSTKLLSFSLVFALFYDDFAPKFGHILFTFVFNFFVLCTFFGGVFLHYFFLLDDLIVKWHRRIIYDVIIEILQFSHSIHSISMSFEFVH